MTAKQRSQGGQEGNHKIPRGRASKALRQEWEECARKSKEASEARAHRGRRTAAVDGGKDERQLDKVGPCQPLEGLGHTYVMRKPVQGSEQRIYV